MSQFKTEFLNFRDKIDLEKHCFVSYDIASMYTFLPIPEIVDLNCEEIYKAPRFFFEREILKSGLTSEFPPKLTFRKLLKAALCKLTAFHTKESVFRQLSGCAMGSRLSCLLADIYLNYRLNYIFENEIEMNNIIYTSRYVDDIICVCDKSKVDNIFKKLNRIHPDIKFTIEHMTNNNLRFLDCEIKGLGFPDTCFGCLGFGFRDS